MARATYAPKVAAKPETVTDTTTENVQRLPVRTDKLDYAYPFTDKSGQLEEGIRGNRDA